MREWTLFSNHGHVLVCLARDHRARLRDVAAAVGITERAVQKIVRELHESGLIAISKQGRCNRYTINTRKSLRHDLESHCTVGKLLQALGDPSGRGADKSSARGSSDAATPTDKRDAAGASPEPMPAPERVRKPAATPISPAIKPATGNSRDEEVAAAPAKSAPAETQPETGAASVPADEEPNTEAATVAQGQVEPEAGPARAKPGAKKPETGETLAPDQQRSLF